MAMFLKQSYEDDFEALLLNLKDKYPKIIFKYEGIDDSQLDMTQYSKNYFIKNKSVSDVSIDQNANVQIKDVVNYRAEMHKGADKLNSLFLIWKTAKKLWSTKYANKLIEEEICKDININDCINTYLPYCWAFDCYDLVEKGLPFITNKPSSPPKHADTLLRHTEQLIMSASRQVMGATAIPNLLVIYSALLKKDINDKKYYVHHLYKDKKVFSQYLKQEFQKFIYTINQPIREGQSPFTNITLFDSIYMKELCSMYLIDGKKIDYKFAMEIQAEFLKIFIDLNKDSLFTFPILTAQLKKDSENEIEDEEFFNFICEQNLDYANLNIFASESLNAISSCCRLISNVDDILKAVKDENINLIGGSSIKVGSFGVSTLNLPRISLYCKGDREVFFERLKELATDCFRLNHCRRELIKKMIEDEQLPLYTHGFIDLKNQYSTLGINGIYEAVVFMGLDVTSEEGKAFTINILKFLDDLVKEKIKKYEYRCNMEQIPAESTAIKFAKTDEILYKQDQFALYSNQFIPLVDETALINRIELQSLFENYFSGGTILHANLSEKIESVAVMKKLVSFIIKKGVQYHAINYFFAECKDGHISVHEGKTCPVCGKKIITYYSRIVGFITPISSWQKERRDEFKERKKYKNGQLELKNS